MSDDLAGADRQTASASPSGAGDDGVPVSAGLGAQRPHGVSEPVEHAARRIKSGPGAASVPFSTASGRGGTSGGRDFAGHPPVPLHRHLGPSPTSSPPGAPDRIEIPSAAHLRGDPATREARSHPATAVHLGPPRSSRQSHSRLGLHGGVIAVAPAGPGGETVGLSGGAGCEHLTSDCCEPFPLTARRHRKPRPFTLAIIGTHFEGISVSCRFATRPRDRRCAMLSGSLRNSACAASTELGRCWRRSGCT